MSIVGVIGFVKAVWNLGISFAPTLFHTACKIVQDTANTVTF